MVMLGTSLRRRRIAQARRVTRESGRRRAPYPPTTVSLWTKPSTPLRSASTTRISRLRGRYGTRPRPAPITGRGRAVDGYFDEGPPLPPCVAARRTLVAAFCPAVSMYLTVTLAPVREAMSSSPTLLEPSHTRASPTAKVQVALEPFTVSVLAEAS